MKLILNGTDISDVVTSVRSEIQTDTQPACDEYGAPVWDTQPTGMADVTLNLALRTDSISHDGETVCISTPGFLSQKQTVYTVEDTLSEVGLATFPTYGQAEEYLSLRVEYDDLRDDYFPEYFIRAIEVESRDATFPKILTKVAIKFSKDNGEAKTDETYELVQPDSTRFILGTVVEFTGKRKIVVSGFSANEVNRLVDKVIEMGGQL